ncbi:MAG: NAD(P)/FAD-dependent oxidoreductase [Flavobacteriales bacterium]|nr:NAD(P)/FAD-dependent oxidoreductase [Flavobacteriales bacterium]
MPSASSRIVVIGGGAAGFMAAISAKAHQPGAEVLLLEKSDKWLAKVRISGGGRCNVTHHCAEPRKLARHFPRGEVFLRKVFAAWGQPQAVDWFAAQGVPLKVEKDGRMFPVTDDSATVIDALVSAARRAGVVTKLHCPVTRLLRADDRWVLTTPEGALEADRVVVATGGSPKDEGLAWLAELGHEVVAAVPSLFTFNLPDDPIRELMGVVAPNVRLRIAGTKLESTGPLLITHWGLSGPAVLRLSAFGARVLHDMKYEYTVLIDWLGAMGEVQARERLSSEASAHPNRQVANAEGFGLPARLWAYLIARAGLPAAKPLGGLGKKWTDRLLDVLTNDRYDARGKTTFKEEFVTAGGIALQQIYPLTMESHVAPGLHFAGEVLDIDGITGGFNFQAAWSTGWLAGKGAGQLAMAESLKSPDERRPGQLISRSNRLRSAHASHRTFTHRPHGLYRPSTRSRTEPLPARRPRAPLRRPEPQRVFHRL